MNVMEYVSSIIRNEKKLSPEDFKNNIYKRVGFKKDHTINARNVEMFSLVFGPISTTEIREANWPAMPDEEAAARLFSRECAIWHFEKARLPKPDGKVHIIYTATKDSRDIIYRMTKSELTSERPLSSLRPHDYVLGYSFFNMILHGYDIDFKKEVLIDGFNAGIGTNFKDSVRADALLSYDGKEYYIEQDMGTETTDILMNKIKKYGDTDKPIIFSFHTRVPKFLYKYNDVCLAADKNADTNNLDKKPKKLRDIYNALSEKKDYSDALDILTKDKFLINKCVRYCALYQFKVKKSITLFKYILTDDEVLKLCMNGTEVYAASSELLYTCRAFEKSGTSQDYYNKLRNFYNDTFVYKRNEYAAGAKFNECLKFKDFTTYIMFPEDNVSDMVKIYKTFDEINENDRYVVFYHTETFIKLFNSVFKDKKTFEKIDFISI